MGEKKKNSGVISTGDDEMYNWFKNIERKVLTEMGDTEALDILDEEEKRLREEAEAEED